MSDVSDMRAIADERYTHFGRMKYRLWIWLTDYRAEIHMPAIGAVVLIFLMTVPPLFFRVTSSWLISNIEETRVEAARACRNPQTLIAYQLASSQSNHAILVNQGVRRIPIVGRWFMPDVWEHVELISVPGAACPEPS